MISLKKLPIVFAFLFIVIIAGGLATYVLLFRKSPEVNSDYNKAQELYQERKHSEAVSYYKKAINNDPTLTDAYTKAAEILLFKGENEEAIMILEKGIGYALEEDEIYKKLAFAYAQEADFKMALQNANLAVEKDGSDEQSKRDRIVYLYLTGDDAEGDKAAEALDPGSDEYLNFVKAILSFKNLEKSLEYAEKSDSQALKETLKKAQEKPEETIANYMDIAYVAVQKDDGALAIPIINAIKASNKYYEGAHIYEGYVNIQYQNYDEAIKNLNAAASYTPNNYQIYKLLAVANYEKDNLPEAEKQINKSLSLNKGLDTLYVAYRVSLSMQKYDKCVEYTSLIYSLEDKTFDNTVDYMGCLILKGDFAKTIEISDKELANTAYNDEERSIIASHKAWAQFKLNQKTEALETFDEAERYEATNAYYKYYKALYFEGSANSEKAKEYFTAAVDADLKGDVSKLAETKLPKEEK